MLKILIKTNKDEKFEDLKEATGADYLANGIKTLDDALFLMAMHFADNDMLLKAMLLETQYKVITDNKSLLFSFVQNDIKSTSDLLAREIVAVSPEYADFADLLK